MQESESAIQELDTSNPMSSNDDDIFGDYLSDTKPMSYDDDILGDYLSDTESLGYNRKEPYESPREEKEYFDADDLKALTSLVISVATSHGLDLSDGTVVDYLVDECMNFIREEGV